MTTYINLRSNEQFSNRESQLRVKCVKLVPLKSGWHSEVSALTPMTDSDEITHSGWHSEVSIPTPMTDLMRIPAWTFLALLGKLVIHPGGRPSTEEMYRLADFQAGQLVLEVGCGVGTTAIEIASRFGCQVTAIDVDSMMLARARINVHNAGLDGQVLVQRADVLDLPFFDQTFDRVVIEDVLVFLNRARAIREILRVCRDGGRVIDHEFAWGEEPPAEVRRAFEETISPNSYFGDWSKFYKAVGLSNIEVVSGASNLLAPASLLRDEGLKNTLAMIGHVFSRLSYLQKMVMLMERMSQISPYLCWTVVGGVKAERTVLMPERTLQNLASGSR